MSQFDDVSGVIIGGEYGEAWLEYEGRQQGAKCYPKDKQEAQELCEAILADIKQECASDFIFSLIYPHNSWQIITRGI